MISVALRIGLWEAHKRRCIYCGEPLSYRQVEIDHLIPRHLSAKKDELREILSELKLPENFDLNDRHNLLPVHAHCNREKSGSVFRADTVLYYLERTAGLADEVTRHEQIYLRKSRGDRVLAALQLALALDELTPKQVLEILDTRTLAKQFEVVGAIEFANRVVSGMLGRGDVESLLDEPLLPRKHGLEKLEMERGASSARERRAVTTCRQWADAVIAGFSPACNYDIKEEAFFKKAYSLIHALSIAQVADTSFLNERVGLNSLELLPVTVLPCLSRDDVDELAELNARGVSVEGLAKEGRVRIERASRDHVSLIFEHLGKAFWAVFRADLNGDGIEDLLVSTYLWATEGTLGVGDR
jgi:HNH endonuclease